VSRVVVTVVSARAFHAGRVSRRPAALLIAALVLASSGCSTTKPPVASAVVDVIGDSLSTGVATPGDPWTVPASQLLARRLGPLWFQNAAENGAGYAMPGQYGDTFLDEVDRVVTPDARVVIVFGSDNDLGEPQLGARVEQTFSRIHELAPHAKMIVVGPPATPAQSPQHLASIRDVLRDQTAKAGGTFVDPVALGWFRVNGSSMVVSDGEHPNEPGERFLGGKMADLITDAMEARSGRAGSTS
jgi:hypothetical protein